MDRISDIYNSKQDLAQMNPAVLYKYATARDIQSASDADLVWMIAIDIMSETSKDIAHMKGGNLNYEYRMALSKAIKDKHIKLYKCDFRKYLKNLKIKPSGASGTTLAFAVIEALHDPQVLVIKMGPSPTEKEIYSDEWQYLMGVQFEALIYKYIVDYMLTQHITPNLPSYYGYINCYRTRRRKFPDSTLSPATTPPHKLKTSGYLFVEQMKGDTLFDYMRDVWDGNTDTMRAILFQILYTLQCFHTFYINHNDIHLNNIFIQTSPDIRDDITYFTDNKSYYTIPINGNFVKLFDFDLTGMDCTAALADPKLPRSVKDQIKKLSDEWFAGQNCTNRKLDRDSLNSLGINNNNTPLFDVYLVFCGMLNYIPKSKVDAEFSAFISNVLGTSVNYKGKFPCRASNLQDPLFKDLKSIPEILNMDFFKKYHNSGIISNNVFHLPGIKPYIPEF